METTIEAMEKRHEAEQAALLVEVKAMIKAAKKSEKAVAEARGLQMQYDLKATQSAEIDDLLERIENGTVVSGPSEETSVQEVEKDEPASADVAIASKVESKKAKALRKKERKQEKSVAVANEKQELLANAGPSKRDIELDLLNAQLIVDNLRVKEIQSDGHCLYRAVADQIDLLKSQGHLINVGTSDVGVFETAVSTSANLDFAILRNLAAQYMRANPADFAPFLGFEEASPEFEDYCRLVENISKAEWGGQLEIRALCAALRVRIVVLEANMPAVMMGEEFISSLDTTPLLRLSFHRHYYALGEHYNSVVPSAKA